ncbi:MAG: IgGFc-binding protein [Polyangiales bacterium]
MAPRSPLVVLLGFVVACSAQKTEAPESPTLTEKADSGTGIAPVTGFDAATPETGGLVPTGDPKSCEEAAASKSYVGCDYWPTVVANNVWSVFDYAVVVANAGTETAEISVTGPGGVSQKTTVAPNALAKVYLPWVPELKGSDFFECAPVPLAASVKVAGGAYHLVSSKPVTVFQFNALEYKGSGGPVGKKWDACPPPGYCRAGGLQCFSYSNDATLLLPSTAMTGHYRVTSIGGWTNPDDHLPVTNAYFAITATQDDTRVEVKVGPKGKVLAASATTEIPATGAGGTFTFSMNAGDVAELACENGADCDPSGSLVNADKPVQVITGVPCTQVPNSLPTCDHIEETVFPAETFGKHYVVAVPTAPRGNAVGHLVRLYGNVDGTKLTYKPGKPKNFLPAGSPAPDELNAGDVIDLASSVDFEITGDQPFAIGSFMIGSSNLDPYTSPPDQKGDPSQTQVVAVEQYRDKYVFLAPDDYDMAWADVISPEGTTVTLDGAPVDALRKVIASGFGVQRVLLGNGAHVLTASKPVGLQVIGYGSYTSYMYPGGLNLKAIAPPPVK